MLGDNHDVSIGRLYTRSRLSADHEDVLLANMLQIKYTKVAPRSLLHTCPPHNDAIAILKIK